MTYSYTSEFHVRIVENRGARAGSSLEEAFCKVARAYSELRDLGSRWRYDMELQAGREAKLLPLELQQALSIFAFERLGKRDILLLLHSTYYIIYNIIYYCCCCVTYLYYIYYMMHIHYAYMLFN